MKDVVAINRASRLALMDDDTTWPISTFLDSNGDECAESQAVCAVVGPCVNNVREFWLVITLNNFKRQEMQ